MQITPRDWQQIALREASELLGTPEGAAKLAEANRYGALADEIERLREALRTVNWRHEDKGAVLRISAEALAPSTR